MDQGQAHISTLHEEILRHIFELNAHMDLELELPGETLPSTTSAESYGQTPWNLRALNVIRYTSQVCQYWRDLIVSSPSIWGNVIDLYLLRQESELWRNEVMRRTGESRLCIKGIVSGRSPLNAFFADVMKNHWSRIRGLDVAILDYELLDSEVWTVLQRPAPHLEFFKMDIDDWRDRQLFSTTRPTLFSDIAPSLREFHFICPSHINLNLSLHAPWLRQLQGLTLTSAFSTSDILEALTNIPFLESLELQNSVIGTHATHRRIDLPRLSMIKIKGSTQLRAALSVLESVAAAPGCALILNTIDTRSINVNIEDMKALQKIISDYASGYFNSRTVDGLTLGLSYRVFYFWVPLLTDGPPNPSPPSFCIDMYCDFPLPPGSIGTLLDSFSTCQFNTVTQLDIRPGGYLRLEKEIDSLNSLASFISLFPSVEILHAPEYALQVLPAILKDHPRVFPLLHTLKIKFLLSATRMFMTILLQFLDQREQDGLPIKVLDITEIVIQQPRDWESLERMVGLKVMWVKDNVNWDYICGSGEPEKLNLGSTVENSVIFPVF